MPMYTTRMQSDAPHASAHRLSLEYAESRRCRPCPGFTASVEIVLGDDAGTPPPDAHGSHLVLDGQSYPVTACSLFVRISDGFVRVPFNPWSAVAPASAPAFFRALLDDPCFERRRAVLKIWSVFGPRPEAVVLKVFDVQRLDFRVHLELPRNP
jgi:hypothetical protein